MASVLLEKGTAQELIRDYRQRRSQGQRTDASYLRPGFQNDLLYAEITTNNGDGTYAGRQKYYNGGWTNTTTDLFSGKTLTELNAAAGITVGDVVRVWPWIASDAEIYFIDRQYVPGYGLGLDDFGSWVKITASNTGTGYHSWAQLTQGWTTLSDTTGLTGALNAKEENGRTGVPSDTVVWLRFGGVDYLFSHDSADDSQSPQSLTSGAGGSESSDSTDWVREEQQADGVRGVDTTPPYRLQYDTDDNELTVFARSESHDASGHLIEVGSESSTVFDLSEGAYGVDNAGGWAKITGSSGANHSWAELDTDASTTTGTTGTNNAQEVNGREGVPNNEVVWLVKNGSSGYKFVQDQGGGSGTDIDATYTGEHSESAMSGSIEWTRGTDKVGVEITVQTGTAYYESGDEKLYAYVRDLAFDSAGHLLSVSAETRIEIEAPEACS